MAKQMTIIGKKITSKQWSNLILELNLIRKAWQPFATIEIQGPGVKKAIKIGTTVKKYDCSANISGIFDPIIFF